jgi:hypothetical protein
MDPARFEQMIGWATSAVNDQNESQLERDAASATLMGVLVVDVLVYIQQESLTIIPCPDRPATSHAVHITHPSGRMVCADDLADGIDTLRKALKEQIRLVELN